MAKIRLTKGELKRQRDALLRFERYLPTLQLKKQQLQMEILRQTAVLEKKRADEKAKRGEIASWTGLLADPRVDVKPWVKPGRVIEGVKNIAGVDLPVFEGVEFPPITYDLFLVPLWADAGIEALRALVGLRREIATLERGIAILRRELRITAQRVNLFEKVKIPEAVEAIRLIKISIGDQMTNAVGRCKIAKRKIGEETLLEVAA